MASQTSSRASRGVSRDTGFPEPFDKCKHSPLVMPTSFSLSLSFLSGCILFNQDIMILFTDIFRHKGATPLFLTQTPISHQTPASHMTNSPAITPSSASASHSSTDDTSISEASSTASPHRRLSSSAASCHCRCLTPAPAPASASRRRRPS
jgi:hypothetical protein